MWLCRIHKRLGCNYERLKKAHNLKDDMGSKPKFWKANCDQEKNWQLLRVLVPWSDQAKLREKQGCACFIHIFIMYILTPVLVNVFLTLLDQLHRQRKNQQSRKNIDSIIKQKEKMTEPDHSPTISLPGSFSLPCLWMLNIFFWLCFMSSFTKQTPTAATKQVQLTQRRRLSFPSHQEGRVWSTVLQGIRLPVTEHSLASHGKARKWKIEWVLSWLSSRVEIAWLWCQMGHQASSRLVSLSLWHWLGPRACQEKQTSWPYSVARAAGPETQRSRAGQ